MRLELEGLEVHFPYDYVYREQFEYMRGLTRSLDAAGHALLEMPTGTGKTVCLLALILSYKRAHPKTGKLIYCTRTVPEMVKCMEEIRRVIACRPQRPGEKFLAICLSARRNLCVHPTVLQEVEGENVDSSCRSITASWVREKGATDSSIELCDYFEGFHKDLLAQAVEIPNGIYSLDDLKEFGKKKGYCPYFYTRYLINHADVIVYNYQYMLDPKVANMVSGEIEKEAIVVFDEAHNIDNVCIEALSVTLDTRAIDSSIRSVHRLQSRVADLKTSDSARLQREYRELMQGLSAQGLTRTTDNHLASPLLSQDVLEEALPGSIRKAEHFIAFLKKIIMYLKAQLKVATVENKTPLAFLTQLQNATALDRKPLRFTYSRLNSLLRTLEITSLEEFGALTNIANFVTLLATYLEGFNVILEPQGSIVKGVSEPLIQLACVDASIAMKPVFDRFQSVIITSGTLSPMSLYPKLLNFSPVISQSLPMTTFRPCLLPLFVTKGSDQTPLSTRFETRTDEAIVRNYGLLLVELCSVVPDGVCCFFPSYMYMEETLQTWDRLGILRDILKHKLIFLETKDVVETTFALDNFKVACDTGKGALFLSISRGKVAEGVDFDRHYGRCVVVLGVPYQYTRSHTLLARLDYMRDKYQIRGNDFLTFDALRQASQCVGRVIRSKTDYGIVILADMRFNRQDKRSKMPPWITSFVKDSYLNMSTEVAVEQIRQFQRQMGQPIDQESLHSILYSTDQIPLLTKMCADQGTEVFEPKELDPPAATEKPADDATPIELDSSEGVVLMKRRRIEE